MINQLKPQLAKILDKKQINLDTVCLTLKFPRNSQKDFDFIAGQFVMAGIPGFGEAPFSVSSDPNKSRQFFEICVRQVGELTKKICQLKKTDNIYIRGPLGNGFVPTNKNLILIAGGCGFIPLKSVLMENLNRHDIKIQIFYGCKNTDSLLFENKFSFWQRKAEVNVILEKKAYKGKKGFVTDLLKAKKLIDNSLVFVCGPEAMYKFVIKELLAKKINPHDIYLSLERRMHCGLGVCQHCAVGTKYVCQDGPVFGYDFLQTLNKYEIDL